MKAFIQRLEKHLDEVPGKIKSLPQEELLRKPAPGKWSKQEIMGHLVDSAIYNIVRFTQAQYRPSPFVVDGYGQDQLVALNDYQHVPLSHLLEIWMRLNRQIIFIWSMMPAEALQLPIIRKEEPKTLGWLIEDYLDHMEHHLGQVFRQA